MRINLNTWYSERQLDFCPKHFIPAITSLDDEKLLWVLENLNGRFFVDKSNFRDIFWTNSTIYFEDSKEVMIYELAWS